MSGIEKHDKTKKQQLVRRRLTQIKSQVVADDQVHFGANHQISFSSFTTVTIAASCVEILGHDLDVLLIR